MSSNDSPVISIVVPTFNQGKYIEQTILSIITQEYFHKELIIIDGGSTDKTVEIIKKYDAKISYWISEPDDGQSHALNKGLKRVTGDLFNWINSDDYLEPGALQAIADAYQKHPNKLVFAGYCRLFQETPPFSKISRIRVGKNEADTIVNFWMNQPSTFYKTEVIKGFGGINMDLHYSMDLELWFRFVAQYGIDKVQLLDNLLSHFRHHGDSKTENEIVKFIADQQQILYVLLDQVANNSSISRYFKVDNLYYTPLSQWQVQKLNKSQFLAVVSERYHHKFYEDRSYKALRSALWRLFIEGKIQGNRYFLSLIFKAWTNYA